MNTSQAEQPSGDEQSRRAYARQKRALHLANMVTATAALGVLAWSPATVKVGRMIQRRTKRRPLATAVGLLATAAFSAGLSLPYDFASGYILERKYGLSNQNKRQWFGDYGKAAALGVMLLLCLGSGFYALVRRSPRRWPVLASLASVPLIVALQAVAPIYFFPLFNKYRRLEEGELRDEIVTLAKAHAVITDEIYVVDMSKQTKKANAFVAGIGSTCRIVLADTLLDNFKPDEILFVLAHEISHYRARDAWKLASISGALAALTFSAIAAAGEAAKRRPQSWQTLDEAGAIPMAAFVANAVSCLALPAINGMTRRMEYAADAYAATTQPELTEPGVRAFERLGQINLAEMAPPGWVEWFFHSHPSLRKRISALQRSRRAAPEPDTSGSRPWSDGGEAC
ncbi:MAG: M48 family metallopeptidase [Candidatus Eremiobacteraeota bacterium]|nr:M48 family metallopeptidase [Candidatus Eremiobacteraeota bacterium]MBC5827073.1 M48 family metallopeptidase [Candidatus Eremiobacteraeota bacterium]